MKQKLVLLSICVCSIICAMAQQQGIVRTLERPGKSSEALAGVTINVLEYPNAIVSKKDGKFSFSISGKRQGDSFTISRVQKKGYTLVDKQLKGRSYAYSSSVPVEIVMVADQQLENDKKRIEDKAYEKAKYNYDQKLAVLEKQLKEKSISEQEYRKRYEELNANYNNYIQLIDQMAERYALTDYKGLSTMNQEILSCIENADLERADELINTKGSFEKREQELNNKRSLKEKSEQLTQELEKDIEIELQDLMQDYYNKYYIHASAYRNDSAAFYLERMVKLDTTNIKYVYDAAVFINHYLADYPRALKYYLMVLNYINANYGEDSPEAGELCQRIGLLYDNHDKPDKALEWHHKALDIMKSTMDPYSPSVSMAYTYIGRAYISKEEYDKALEYTLTGLEMRERSSLKDTAALAQSYNNLGIIYNRMNETEKALEYHLKALGLREQAYGADSDEAAFSHLNIGDLYCRNHDDKKALEHLNIAHQKYLPTLGAAHPYTMTTTSRLGEVYLRQGEYDKALKYFQEYCSGVMKYYGEYSYEAAAGLDYLGGVYYASGDYAHALECYQQVLVIYESLPNIQDDILNSWREAIQKLKDELKKN